LSQTIFVIDDEASITDSVQFALEREGFQVSVFPTGQDALDALSDQKPSLFVLDVGLTDGSGFDFFRQYREISHAPVIFLTARDDEIDRVVGLEMGADDYIGKPFSLRELVARVRVVLRRNDTEAVAPNNNDETDSVFRTDEARKKIHYYDVMLTLTAHEYRLLDLLLSQPGRVYSRIQLLEKAWDAPEHRLERTVDTHIKEIRLKLREINKEHDPIKTHRGMGYSLEPEN
jgi:two-component system catabolic regulation response regulator CreB